MSRIREWLGWVPTVDFAVVVDLRTPTWSGSTLALLPWWSLLTNPPAEPAGSLGEELC